MSSLINSQHLFRQATRERGIIELKMRMIDVRCRAMESIATQATLLAGFAFGSLQPDVLDTLWINHDAKWFQLPFSAIFVLSASIAFAASIWVIYMSLFAGWRAQFSALQGGMEGAMAADTVDESLRIVRLTSERVTLWFSAALCFTAFSVLLLAFAHLPWASLGLVAVFAFFLRDAVKFRSTISEQFHALREDVLDSGAEHPPSVSAASYAPSRSCCVEFASSPAASKQLAAQASAASGKVRAQPKPRVSLPATRSENEAAEALNSAALAASASRLGAAASRADETESRAPASVLATEPRQLRVSGWMYKSPSRLGPPAAREGGGADGATAAADGGGGGGKLKRISAASLLAAGRSASARLSLLPTVHDGVPVPQDKRYFVLHGHELSWYSSKDDVTLGSAPKTTVDMRLYACTVVDAAELILSLTPASSAAKKSWYLRAEDAESFETWRWALESVSGEASSPSSAIQASGADGSPLAHLSSAAHEDAADPDEPGDPRGRSFSTVRM